MACDFPESSCESYENTVRMLADGLLLLQAVDISNCPFDCMLETKFHGALYNIENSLVDIDNLREDNRFTSPMDLYNHLISNSPPEELCFTHGDYCLPNIFIDKNDVTGFIDLGNAGVADRWQDIALCVRSLRYNLRNVSEKEKYINLLFEYLNIKPDWDKINYYILLDLFF